ncbi:MULTISPECIES: radical SAM family heme chaperone HemW [unclassified Oceanispirochaeta]|uniref:radical SAM family heme chaperone HemW n=1 Tax=unclassified Oceanispirochaeta TaxID=2635722 RepID=UPI000E093093|nr:MULTISPECIES: radical SAM family heme chaperone HemW [unclassified Oceanispirochaeta]MBF9015156.1 radical SAM family heme chaperone HemW [Oceanispirochaeta sp. M2]NPD71614.1 radical SAM family heme chaperone HemW [Oceanispirochaeta sp. M1]RDG33181.1 coproporphyrinogen III oxidase family protein [Oceanispirochaeta sp. M1]
MNESELKPYSAALYIHIPYCVKKCDYCDFYSCCDLSSSESLLSQIPIQIAELSKSYSINGFTSVYLGGGTPALVNAVYLKTLLHEIYSFNGGILPDEVTMECNPRNVNPGNLAIWADAGINRISLGVQSFQDIFLEKAGRRSSRKTILDALEMLKVHRDCFDLNIDLIQGLPGMTENNQLSDLEEAVKWQPDHISWYSLLMEPGTVLSKNWSSRNQNTEVDNDEVWLSGCRFLEQKGYSRYEISNFSLSGKESVHNSSYWKMYPYLGCGPAAVSMLRGTDGAIKRFRTRADAESYSRGQIGYDEVEVLKASDFLKDYLLMGLRITQGIDLQRFTDVFGVEITEILPKSLKRWSEQHCLTIDETSLKCTEQGLDLQNSILISFFEEIDAGYQGGTLNWPPEGAVE